MHKYFIAILVTFSLLLTVCGQQQDSKTSDSQSKSESDEKIDWCEKGCAQLQKLGCPKGNDLRFPQSCDSTAECAFGSCTRGFCTQTCIEFCEPSAGQCWAAINDCSEVEDCR